MGRIMRKPDLCLCKNIGADQLCSNCTTGKCLCFHYMDRLFLVFLNLLAIFCHCTDSESDLGGNPEDLSRIAALPHIIFFLSCKGKQIEFENSKKNVYFNT